MWLCSVEVNVAQIDVTAKRQSQNASGQSLSYFTMRNKLKRSKNFTHTTWQSKGQTQATEAETLLLSESSCDGDKTSPEPSAGNKHGSNAAVAAAAAISKREDELLQEQKKKLCCAKDIKIAPIFLRQSESKRSSNSKGKVEQPVEKTAGPPQREEARGVKSQHQVSSAVSQLIEEDGFNMSTARSRLSPSALHTCLEEIKASHPAFPVHTVFSALQKKASDNLQDVGATGKINHQTLNSLSFHYVCWP